MPEMDGIQATRLVPEKRPECRVIVLTSFTDDDKISSILAKLGLADRTQAAVYAVKHGCE